MPLVYKQFDTIFQFYPIWIQKSKQCDRVSSLSHITPSLSRRLSHFLVVPFQPRPNPSFFVAFVVNKCLHNSRLILCPSPSRKKLSFSRLGTRDLASWVFARTPSGFGDGYLLTRHDGFYSSNALLASKVASKASGFQLWQKWSIL